jgi:hypothetical protein
MKKPKSQKPDDAPAFPETESQIQSETAVAEAEVEILTEEQGMRRMAGCTEEKDSSPSVDEDSEPEVDPMDQIAELEAIFAKLPEKMNRLRDLEALKAKYLQEIEDFKIDPLAADADRRLSIRRSRENLVEMIDIDIWKILDSPDPDKARARFLANGLAQCVRKAIDRDISLLCNEVRAFVKGNPAATFLFDDLELQDSEIRNFPVFRRALRIASVSDSFNDSWMNFEAERLCQEFPKFLEITRKAAFGERILALPEAD